MREACVTALSLAVLLLAAGALKPLGTMPGMADEDAKGKDDEDAKYAKDKDAPRAAKAGGDEEEGHSELWTLRGTPYAQLVVKADAGGHGGPPLQVLLRTPHYWGPGGLRRTHAGWKRFKQTLSPINRHVPEP